MYGSLPQRMRRAAALVALTALLVLPAAVSTARPAAVADDGPAAVTMPSSLSSLWSHLTSWLPDWLGGRAPAAPQHVTGGSERGNVGSTLDPDGLTATDPGAIRDPQGNVGSTLDPDGAS